jgi:hypothetical protein
MFRGERRGSPEAGSEMATPPRTVAGSWASVRKHEGWEHLLMEGVLERENLAS